MWACRRVGVWARGCVCVCVCVSVCVCVCVSVSVSVSVSVCVSAILLGKWPRDSRPYIFLPSCRMLMQFGINLEQEHIATCMHFKISRFSWPS